MISFIIPAYNEETLLGRTLTALHAAALAQPEPYEVIVADDASTDRTSTIAAEQGARVLQVNHRQIAATRNAGAAVATGELFVFVDADTVVNAEVVRAAERAVRRGAVGGGWCCAWRAACRFTPRFCNSFLAQSAERSSWPAAASSSARAPRSWRRDGSMKRCMPGKKPRSATN
jgi:glycosyltransferase involved in cell wall biosynthesis